MSLLESMRSGTDSSFMQIVLAVVVISFIGWGAQNGGQTRDTVATVNGEAITSIEYGQALRFREMELSQRTKGAVPEDMMADLRERVLQDLIRSKAIAQEAKALGVEVSDAEVANYLLGIQGFLDENGDFDMREYDAFIRSRGTTRANFEEDLREDLLLRKLEGLMQLGANVAEPVVKQMYVDQNTQVDLEFVRIRPAAFAASIEPGAEELATWIAENDAALKARYERDFSRLYDVKESVKLSAIKITQRDDGLALADLKPKLDAARAELLAGADFAAKALELSTDPSKDKGGDLGELRVADLDPEVAKAVASLSDGQLSEVVVGARDVALYRLDGRTPARVVPIAEVQEAIAKELIRESQAPIKAVDFAENTLLKAWQADGAVPQEALDTYGFKVANTGPIPLSGAGGGLFRPPEAMLKAARDAEVGAVLPEVYEDQGVYWVGRVVERIDADLAAYETERDAVREGALIGARNAFYQAWVDDVVARADVRR